MFVGKRRKQKNEKNMNHNGKYIKVKRQHSLYRLYLHKLLPIGKHIALNVKAEAASPVIKA